MSTTELMTEEQVTLTQRAYLQRISQLQAEIDHYRKEIAALIQHRGVAHGVCPKCGYRVRTKMGRPPCAHPWHEQRRGLMRQRREVE